MEENEGKGSNGSKSEKERRPTEDEVISEVTE